MGGSHGTPWPPMGFHGQNPWGPRAKDMRAHRNPGAATTGGISWAWPITFSKCHMGMTHEVCQKNSLWEPIDTIYPMSTQGE